MPPRTPPQPPFCHYRQRGGAAAFLAHPRTGQFQTVVLSVRDNGPGIPAYHLPYIFDAGFSTRPENHDEEAHGLGLSIVSQLVTAAGGAVRAVSPPGLGARFDIQLPILRPEGREQPGSQLPLYPKN